MSPVKFLLKSSPQSLALLALALGLQVTVGCATNSMEKDGVATSSNDASSVGLTPTSTPTMRHDLRDIVEYDISKMIRLVNAELDMREPDEDVFLNEAANVLGQTVLLQTHFTEREGALRELKSKIDQEDFIVVVEKAADNLLTIYKTSTLPSDQAAALVSLTNLVTEIKAMKNSDLKPTLQKIAQASLRASDSANKYANESMQRLISPSSEAKAALQLL